MQIKREIIIADARKTVKVRGDSVVVNLNIGVVGRFPGRGPQGRLVVGRGFINSYARFLSK
jgi:hypothetical protein